MTGVMLCRDINPQDMIDLFAKYQLHIELIDSGKVIPGSFWGESEAGLKANKLLIREDTPVHSALHEGCHYICMDQQRRNQLDTDAAGDYDEENGVCYLQIVLADYLEGVGKKRLMEDMDRWGYSFRLGSSQRWFYEDAEDALQWLIKYGIIDQNSQPTWCLR